MRLVRQTCFAVQVPAVSRSILTRLGVEAYKHVDIVLADGTKIRRQVGDAYFELAGDGGGPFWLELCDGAIRGDSGRLDAPDLVLSTDLETWRKLNAGELKAPTAVMKGRLRFQGSMYLALKIHFILG